MRSALAVAVLATVVPVTSCGGQTRCEKARAEVKHNQTAASGAARSLVPVPTPSRSVFTSPDDVPIEVSAAYAHNAPYAGLINDAANQDRQIVLDDPGCFDPAVVASLRTNH